MRQRKTSKDIFRPWARKGCAQKILIVSAEKKNETNYFPFPRRVPRRVLREVLREGSEKSSEECSEESSEGSSEKSSEENFNLLWF